MSESASLRPRLRPVEVFPINTGGQNLVLIHDPSGYAAGSITVSGAALFLLSMMDGQHTLEQMQRRFFTQFRQPLALAQIEAMVRQLDEAHFLDNENFAAHYRSLVEAYRQSPTRPSGNTAGMGAEADGLGPTIQRMLDSCDVPASLNGHGRLAGIIAPHLDFGRGRPCYADAYGLLRAAGPADRYVILGTNHFGRATSVVATCKDFQTPLGTTRTDRAFLEALSGRCGYDLCEHEFDHLREHSVELQVLILQQIFGAERFEIVPILCHDPCGPNGTGPYDGNGVDLKIFAEALRDLVREDGKSTVIIAGADLSHVGRRFGDNRELDEAFLHEVASKDRQALEHVARGDEAAFVEVLAGRANDTRVCSAGCIYALMTALPDASPALLRYHQAVDAPSGTCVTCSSVAFWERNGAASSS